MNMSYDLLCLMSYRNIFGILWKKTRTRKITDEKDPIDSTLVQYLFIIVMQSIQLIPKIILTINIHI